MKKYLLSLSGQMFPNNDSRSVNSPIESGTIMFAALIMIESLTIWVCFSSLQGFLRNQQALSITVCDAYSEDTIRIVSFVQFLTKTVLKESIIHDTNIMEQTNNEIKK